MYKSELDGDGGIMEELEKALILIAEGKATPEELYKILEIDNDKILQLLKFFKKTIDKNMKIAETTDPKEFMMTIVHVSRLIEKAIEEDTNNEN